MRSLEWYLPADGPPIIASAIMLPIVSAVLTCVRTPHSDISHPLPPRRRCNPNGMTHLNALTAPQITQLINPRKCAKCNRRL